MTKKIKNPRPAKAAAAKRIKHLLEFAALALAALPLAVLPLGLARKCGEWLGALYYYLLPGRRAIAVGNIEAVRAAGALKDQRPAGEIALAAFRRMGRVVAELGKLFLGMRGRMMREVRIEGEEHMRAAMDSGKGVIVVTGHVGNWEIMANALSLRYGHGVGIAKKQHNPYLNNAIERIRTATGASIVYQKDALRHTLRALRDNIPVFIVADERVFPELGVNVNFLGYTMPMISITSVLAKRTGAAVLPCLMEDGGVVRFGPAFELTGEAVGDTQMIVRYFEDYISAHPEEWLTWLRAWKWLPGYEKPPGVMRTLGHLAVAGAFYAACFTVGYLPRKVARGIGRTFGAAAYYALGSRRRIGLNNIGNAQKHGALPGDRRPEQVLRSYFMNMGAWTADLMKVYAGRGEAIVRGIRIEGGEHFEAAKARGKGIIVTTAHVSSWELMALSFSATYGEAYGVAKKQKNPYIDRIVVKLREKFGGKVIYKDGALRKFLAIIKAKGLVAILMDQHASHTQGVQIDFLGSPAWTHRMPAALARRTGATVLPIFISEEGGVYVIRIEPPITLPEGGDDAADTKAMTEPIERFIRNHPDQWLWTHRRWKKE